MHLKAEIAIWRGFAAKNGLEAAPVLEFVDYFFCGGTSVQTPSNISAAMPTDSPSVGCG